MKLTHGLFEQYYIVLILLRRTLSKTRRRIVPLHKHSLTLGVEIELSPTTLRSPPGQTDALLALRFGEIVLREDQILSRFVN